MVVYRSPLGRLSGNQPIPPLPPTEPKKKPELTYAEKKAKEFLELNKSVDTAIERVRNQPDKLLSGKEKQEIIAALDALAKQGVKAGKPPESGFVSKVSSGIRQVVGGVISPFSNLGGSRTREASYQATFGAAQRVVQSGIKEISDARANLGIDPAVNIFRRPSFTVMPPSAGGPQSTAELGDRITSKADPELLRQLQLYSGVSGDPIKPSFKDFVSQAKDPDWFYRDTATSKAINAYSPAKGFFSDLGIDLVSEPASYITGIGNVKYIGRAGKIALAQRFTTREMVQRFPQLVGKYNDIVRFGQHAPIEGFREILKSEGIQTGVRILGQPVKGTDVLAEPLGRAVSATWETIMDIAMKSGRNKFTPASRVFMSEVGRKTVGFGSQQYRVTDIEALGKIAHWSARQYSKGRVPLEISRATNEIRETVEAIQKGPLADTFYDLVETANPNTVAGRVRFDALPDDGTRELIEKYVNWQNSLRTRLGDIQQGLAAEYGLDIKEIGFIDNYLTHRLTGKGQEWLRVNRDGAAKRLGWDRSNLDLSDMRDAQEPLRHRKYRAPELLPDGTFRTETFMGEEVKLGTIKELNEIFRRQSGTDIDFFETRIDHIADSYARAMGKAQGVVAYTRRVLQYGEDVARPLLKTMVPDPVLRAATAKELDKALSIRADIRRAFGRRMVDLRSVIKQGTADAQSIVDGNLKRTKLTKKDLDAAYARIDELEETLASLKVASSEYAADKRGDFDLLHSELTLSITNLRASLDSGNAELDEILLSLQTTYQTMYPNVKKIPTDIDVLADRISTARGIPAAREVRAINVRLTEAKKQLDVMSPKNPDYAELVEEVAILKDLDNGYRVMAEYRGTQDYAPDNGFLYISGREMAEVDEMQAGLKLLRTSATGFPDPADVMGVRVFGNDEVIDFRTRSGVARTFGAFDFGDGIVDQLKLLQVDPEPLQTGLDAVRVGLPMDPDLERAFPEVADLVKLMDGNQAREIMPYGDPELVKVIYEEMVDATTGLLMKVGVENADYVARQVVDGALGFVATKGVDTNSARGILLPASLFDDAAAADDIVVVLAPRVALTASDSVTAAVQTSDNPLLSSVIRSGEEQAAGATRGKLNELRSRQEAELEITISLKQEIANLNRRKGGLKSAATRRRNSAALAKERAGTAKNLPREIEINGKVESLTLPQINKRLEFLSATESRLRANMERTLVREQSNLRVSGVTTAGGEAKLMDNLDRVKVLQNQVLALQTWDAGTGMVVRDEVAAAIDLIASMPPTGAAGEATREWLARLQREVQSTTIISNPAVARNYKRLTELLAFDEWNLAIADEVVEISAKRLEDIESGVSGSVLAPRMDLLLEGWEEIGTLGVQIPSEIMDIWRPNLERVFRQADRSNLSNGLGYLNKIFKTYAVGTVGFVVRNMYSAVFMNAVAGVDAPTMGKAWKAMHFYNKYGAGKWLDELGIVGTEREAYEQAIMAVEATGTRGMFTDLASPALRGGKAEAVLNKVLNNPYTRTIRGANTRVEQAVRFPLALKAIMDGDDYVGAASQIARYQFDYSDLSKVDEKFMQVVPFWIWTTRNLPTQIVNQWMRPQMYSFYDNIKDNLPTDDSVMAPSWLKNYEPLSLARFAVDPKLMIRADMPFKRMNQTIEQFTNPAKFIGSMYPAYKLPIELAAGKSLGLDIPFSDKPREAKGFDAVLAKTLGNIPFIEGAYPRVRMPDGTTQTQTSDFASYALGNAFPIIATLQRLTGGALGGKESYKDRQNASIATYFGLPLDYVTDRMEGSEAVSRQFGIRDYLDMLKRLGYLEAAQVTKDRVQAPIKAAEKAAKEKAERDKNQAINAKSTEVLKAKDQFGTKSEEYKKLKQELDDLKNPKKRQKRVDEENIVARFGKDSPEHQRFLEELNLIKEKP